MKQSIILEKDWLARCSIIQIIVDVAIRVAISEFLSDFF